MVHAAVVGSSILALVLTGTALDVPAIGARSARRTPARLIAAVLALLAAGPGGLWVSAAARSAAPARR